jgi:hypothetical protein
LITLAPIEQIETFLEKVRCCIQQKNIRLVPRRKSLDTLNNLGISIQDAFAMVEEMTYENYYRGPSPERNPNFNPGDIWEFGIEIETDDLNDVYVKLKDEQTNYYIICLSFHEAEYPINYPYKQIKNIGG